MITNGPDLRPWQRLTGVWEGTATRLDASGNQLDAMQSRIVQRIDDGTRWFQRNEFTLPDGRVNAFELGGHIDDQGRLIFEAPHLKGIVYPVSDGVTVLVGELAGDPPGVMWEMTNVTIEGERHRTSQRTRGGQFDSITVFNEVRVADA